jgi:hypothetical protein
MHRPKSPPEIYAEAGEELSELDRQAVEAGLAEIERSEILTLAELRRELEEHRPNTN